MFPLDLEENLEIGGTWKTFDILQQEEVLINFLYFIYKTFQKFALFMFKPILLDLANSISIDAEWRNHKSIKLQNQWFNFNF